MEQARNLHSLPSDVARSLTADESQSAKNPISILDSFIKPSLSAFGATFGLTSLVLSSVIAKTGPIVWLTTLILAMFVNYISFIVLLKIAERHKLTSFMQLSTLFNNSLITALFQAIYFLLNFGVLLTACLVFNSLLTQVFSQFGYSSLYFTANTSFMWVVLLHILSLPLLLKRKLSELSIITIFSFFSCIYITCFLVTNAFFKDINWAIVKQKAFSVQISEIPSSYSINFFIYSLQINLYSLYHELPRPSLTAIKPIIWTTFSFLTLIYILMGFAGFICFVEDSQSLIRNEIILKMFDNSQRPVFLATVLMILTSLNTFFFSFKPTKDTLMNICFGHSENDELPVQGSKEEAKSNSRNLLMTLALMLASLAFSTLIIVFEVSFVYIIDIIADVFMPFLFVFFPLVYYLKTEKDTLVIVALAVSSAFYTLNLLMKFGPK